MHCETGRHCFPVCEETCTQFVEVNETEVVSKDFTARPFFIHSVLQQCTYSHEVLGVLTHLFSGAAHIQWAKNTRSAKETVKVL